MEELQPIDSSREIEKQYKEELLAFFNSGTFLFDTQFANNPIKLQNALIEHYSNDKLKRITKRLYSRISEYHKSEFDSQIPSDQAKLLEIERSNISSNDIHSIIDGNSTTYIEQLQFLNYLVIRNLRDDFIYSILLAIMLQELFNLPKKLECQIINNAVAKINDRIEIISSDQAIKITNGLTMFKCKALGLNQYKWQTMEDDKVRPTHAKNNQLVFTWDNPPHDTGHPGTEINCRCRAVVIVDHGTGNLLDLI